MTNDDAANQKAWVDFYAQYGMTPPLKMTDQEAERIRQEWERQQSPTPAPLQPMRPQPQPLYYHHQQPQPGYYQPIYHQPVPVAVRHEKPFPHGLHLIITLASCGIWLPVWLLAWALHAAHPANRAKVQYY
jgi:hypothetical protein